MSNTMTVPVVKNDEWKQAEDKARDAAADVGAMAGHAASAVGTMASQAACDLGKQADNATASAGVGIQGFGDQIGKHTPHAGTVGNASQAFARSVKGAGEYLEEAKLSGMTEDVAQLIRRNPIPSALIAIGLGWFVANKLRS